MLFVLEWVSQKSFQLMMVVFAELLIGPNLEVLGHSFSFLIPTLELKMMSKPRRCLITICGLNVFQYRGRSSDLCIPMIHEQTPIKKDIKRARCTAF